MPRSSIPSRYKAEGEKVRIVHPKPQTDGCAAEIGHVAAVFPNDSSTDFITNNLAAVLQLIALDGLATGSLDFYLDTAGGAGGIVDFQGCARESKWFRK